MNQAFEFAYRVVYPKVKPMFFFPKKRLNEAWSLAEVYERTSAANQLGYDVYLSADEDGLRFKYVEKRPERIPSNWSQE